MKRYLSLCLAALLVLALLPTMALTGEYTVDTAEDLDKAIREAESGDTIKLTDDITLGGPEYGVLGANNTAHYEITQKNITIDGADHTITVDHQKMEGEHKGPILFGFNGDGATGGSIKNLTIDIEQQSVKHAIQAYGGAYR